jgi:O-antigen ligase/Flp pilus assembly protein TadD
VNYLYIALLVVGLVLIELLIGGTRLVFSLPTYGILALVSFLSLYSFRRSQVPANLKCLIAAGAFAGYIILRILFSPVDYIARADLFMLLGSVMIYLFVALYLTVPKYRFIFVMTLLVIALVHVTIGGIQYLRGERFPIFDFIEKADYGLRATGLYICPNHLAGFLEVSALMGLSIVCWSRQNFWVKLLSGYGAVICGIGLVLTGSRGGYLSTFIGVLTFAVLSFLALRRAHRRQIWITAVGAVVVAVLLLLGITALFSRHYALQARASKALVQDVRTQIWKIAVDQFKLKPVLGTGGGTFQYYGRLFRPSNLQSDPEYVHNDYLQLLAEYGAIGLILGLVFLGVHLVYGLKALNYFVTERPIARYRLQSDALALNIGALSAAAIYVVHSIFDFNLHIPANALLLAFVFGTLANPGIVMPHITETSERITHYLKLALPAVGVWIAVSGLPSLPAEYFAEQARVAFREERYKNAVELADLGLSGDPRNPYLHLYKGQAHSSLGENTTDPKEARDAFTAAVTAFRNGLRLYPQDQWMLIGLGSALDGLGRFAEARPIYEEAIRWNPTSAPIHLYFATHLRLAGQFDEAERMYRKSLDLYWNQGALYGLDLLAKARAGNKPN